MRLLLAATLLIQALLILSLMVTRVWPALRIWPPPSRRSWQFYFTWVGEYLQLSGVFLLALFGWNQSMVPLFLRPAGLGALC